MAGRCAFPEMNRALHGANLQPHRLHNVDHHETLLTPSVLHSLLGLVICWLLRARSPLNLAIHWSRRSLDLSLITETGGGVAPGARVGEV